MDINELHIVVNELAISLGFSAYAATPAVSLNEEMVRFREYLNNRYNADMSYLERNCDMRENPDLLMKGSKSILCFLVSYKNEQSQNPDVPQIASYAFGKDYHKVIKDRLYVIAEKIKEYYPDINYRVFTDSAPVLEKAWAVKAGLGFIGKNTMLINKKTGIKTFIGLILTDLVVKYSWNTEKPGCGTCTKCLEACPTGALTKEYVLDSRKCISYQTIESKRAPGRETYKVGFNNYIFGCDICIDACPWNSKGEYTSITDFFPDFVKINRNRIDWDSMQESEFLEQYKESALLRAGLLKIKENLNHDGV